MTLTTNEDAPFLSQQVAALERRGVSFTTLAVPGDPAGTEGRGPLDYLRYVPRVIREAGPEYDLVHAHYGLIAPMALAQARLPVVLSLWGSDLLGSVAPISRFCARFCEEVIVMSAEMRRHLDGDCEVIPDGIDLERFEPRDRNAARAAVGWTENGYDVLFPYAPSRTIKDHPRAKRIVARADERLDRPVTLRTVYGVDHDEIPTYMNAADALLLTSESEGSPNAVKEALACNVPVVSTAVGDVPERLDGIDPSTVGETDLELVDGLVSVLRRGERPNGRAAVRELSLERTTDAWLDVYERAVGRETVRRPRRRASRSRPSAE